MLLNIWFKIGFSSTINNKKKEIPMDRKIVYTVTFNSETSDASCECKLFESHGIMCSHQFKVFDDNGVKEVPSKYILRRWRKDVHRRHTRVKVAYHDPTKTEEVKRYDRIMVQFDSVCLKAATRPEYAKMAFEAICKLEKSLDAAILKESDKEGAAIKKKIVNAATLKESDKGAESVGSEAATMESSPSMNMDLEGIGTVPPSDFAGSCMVSSALGLDDISIDPVVNNPTQAIVVANDDSSVNDNLTPASVQKPLSVGDPISRKKAHRPRAKRFLSFAEKCARNSLPTHSVPNNGVVQPQCNAPKPKRKRGRKAKDQEPATIMHGHFQASEAAIPTMWVGGIGYGPAYGEVGYFTRSIQSCPEWVSRDVLPFSGSFSGPSYNN